MNLFVDDEKGVIRSRSLLPGVKHLCYDQMHSILFPDVHYFTKRLKLYTHETEITLNEMELKLW